jgi:hypothetical protein
MDNVTLLRPARRPSSDGSGVTSSVPRDLLDQIRGRVRLLALFLLAAFAFDPALALAARIIGFFIHKPPSPEFITNLPFQWVDLAAAVASAGLWWVAGRRVPPSRLLLLGLTYEVVICFVISISTFWQACRISRGSRPSSSCFL